MSIEIGIMVLMCALAAAGLTAAWYYYDECKHWRESYEDIEREYRAESHIWHNRVAELERQARWRVETPSRPNTLDPRTRGPDGMTGRMQAAEQRPGQTTDRLGGTKPPQDQPLSPNTQDFLSALYGDDSWKQDSAPEPVKHQGPVERDEGFGGFSLDDGSSTSDSSTSDSSSGSTD